MFEQVVHDSRKLFLQLLRPGPGPTSDELSEVAYTVGRNYWDLATNNPDKGQRDLIQIIQPVLGRLLNNQSILTAEDYVYLTGSEYGAVKGALDAIEKYLQPIDVEAEQARWQNSIYKLLVSKVDDPSAIDGSGCESGDPLDVTLDEINQAFDREPVFDTWELSVILSSVCWKVIDAENAAAPLSLIDRYRNLRDKIPTLLGDT